MVAMLMLLGSFSTGLLAREERACGREVIVEFFRSFPLARQCTGLEPVAAPTPALTPECSVKSASELKEKSSTSGPEVKDNSKAGPPESLSCKIAALSALSPQQLRDEWRRLYRGQPPRLSRDLLIRALAYRTQELLHGGLSKATERQLAAVTKELAAGSDGVLSPQPRLRPGARLAREWRGRTHTVVVTEDGFDYAGEAYSSLTKIAHRITGAHWSGPRFFGLTPKQESVTEPNQNSASRHADIERDDV
jgi:hypothetical protein